MLLETRIHKIGGSHMIVIPGKMVEYFDVKPGKCNIEDTCENEARLVFKKRRQT